MAEDAGSGPGAARGRGRGLLPHERWLADRIVRRQERDGSSPEAWHRSFGPAGARLLHASVADQILGWTTCLAGVAIGASLGDGPASVITMSISAAAGLGTIAFGAVRQAQAARARKEHQRL